MIITILCVTQYLIQFLASCREQIQESYIELHHKVEDFFFLHVWSLIAQKRFTLDPVCPFDGVFGLHLCVLMDLQAVFV